MPVFSFTSPRGVRNLRSRLVSWLWANRTSARAAFVLRIFSMGFSAVMSWVWIRLLVHAMGKELYGLFISFQAIPRLGGLGDLGISGAVAIRTGRMLGRNEEGRLAEFLASARSLFVILGILLGAVFFGLSPYLSAWLHFKAEPGSGSLTLLFQTGALALLVTIIGGYVHSVNAGANNIIWPIIPGVLLTQGALLGHWLLARAGCPLWAQHCSYVVSSLILTVVVWWLLRVAHPALAMLRPLTTQRVYWRELLSTGGFVYLYGLGAVVFTMTDRLLVNAGFGAAVVASYFLN